MAQREAGAAKGASRAPRARRKPKPKANRWTNRRRADFLEALADTANVRGSARAAGMSESAARGLRRREPEFARLWDQALRDGYERLEALLYARAVAGLSVQEEDAKSAAVSEKLALALLSHHRTRVNELRSAAGEESDAVARARLIEVLAAMHARIAVGRDTGGGGRPPE